MFVFDAEILDALPDRDDRRVSFLWDAVEDLRGRLAARGAEMLVLHGRASEEVPALVERLGGGIRVHASHDQEPGRLERDRRVERALAGSRSSLSTRKDATVFERDEVLTGAGRPHQVWTPYRRAWGAALARDPGALSACPSDELLEHLLPAGRMADSGPRRLEDIGFRRAASAPRGDRASARARWDSFRARMDDYHRLRDRVDLEGTSDLGMDLRFGTISVRELVREALVRGGEGAGRWLDQLVWREFHQMLLWAFPASATTDLRPGLERVRWDDPDADPASMERWSAWCEGRTGYPIVDAAQRALVATGRMHNRLRMVSASFLTKDLHIHWTRGERFFARHLLDFDLAQNVGGWQWAASTGADGQPWFRVFNPVLQGARWDPDGAFVRRHCPELAGIPSRWIHAPWTAPSRPAGWPDHPVVDHAVERVEAIARFRAAGAAPG